MKNYCAALAIIGLFISFTATAQNNNVGIGTTTPDASAILELESTSQGVLVPRMTEAERNNIKSDGGSALTTTEAGLLIYQTDQTPGFYYFTGTVWIALSNVVEVDPKVAATTTNVVPKWNGTSLVDGTITDNAGDVGVGVPVPNAKLDIAGDIKITDGTEGDGKVLTSDPNGLASWQTLDGSNILSAPLIANNLSCPNLTGSVSTGNQNPNSAAVSGNYTYVVSGFSNSLQIIDHSNPAAPVAIGSVSTGAASYPVAVALSGNYSCVVNFSSQNMKVIDISDPTAPAVVGTIATGNQPVDVAIAGSFAYVANRSDNTIQVFDISTPAVPVSLGTVTTGGGGPRALTISGSYAYVVNGSNNVQVIDISVPASPTVSGTVTALGLGSGIDVLGNYACVVYGNQNYMKVIDISDPTTPVVVSTISTGSGSAPSSVAMSGNYAYVANKLTDDVQIFDISNPAVPVLEGTQVTDIRPNTVIVAGNYGYVINETDKTLQIFNLACSGKYAVTIDPSTGQTTASALSGNDILSTPIVPNNLSCPNLTGSVSTGSQNPSSAAVSGNYTYVVSGFSNSLQIIDHSNPAAPIAVGSVSTGAGSYPTAVALSGNYACVVNFSSENMKVIDISDPTAPAEVGTIATGNQPVDVAVSGSFAYVANRGNSNIEAFDLSNPAVPVSLGTVSTASGSPRALTISGDYAYVVNGSNKVQVIDISTPASLSVVGTVSALGLGSGIDVLGNYACVVYGNQNYMKVIDISDPTTPVVVSTISTGSGSAPSSVAMSGNYAYVANKLTDDVQIFDISNPAVPVLEGTQVTDIRPNTVIVAGNYGYVINETDKTLQIFNLTCPGNYAVTIDPTTGITSAIELGWSINGKDMSNDNSGNVGIGASIPNSSAKLDVESTTKGFLPPRMTEQQRIDIATPTAGLMVWCTDCGTDGELQVYNGTDWTNMVGDAAKIRPPVAGNTFQGGIVIYVLQSGDLGYDANVPHGLIAATVDQSTGLNATWGCYNTLVAGADGSVIGTGMQNTIDIISNTCHLNDVIVSAAELCTLYSVVGVDGITYDDWYLPSINELNKMKAVKHLLSGLSTNAYWSSTEADSQHAQQSHFSAGAGQYTKAAALNARAIRSY